jgi:hypothetical protein
MFPISAVEYGNTNVERPKIIESHRDVFSLKKQAEISLNNNTLNAPIIEEKIITPILIVNSTDFSIPLSIIYVVELNCGSGTRI